MSRKILIACVVVLAALVAIIARQPDTFSVTRSVTMQAPIEDIFDQVNDFHKWQAWSPWAEMDPNAKIAYDGEAAGKGAIFKWDGNSDVGTGTLTIMKSQPYSVIEMRLDFEKPMQGTNYAAFKFDTDGKQTIVTWTMLGKANFISKAIGLVMNCEKIVGEQFDKGLNNIKKIVEKPGIHKK